MLFALHVLRAIFPVGSLRQLSFQVFHGQSLATLLRISRTNIGTVTATQTVEHVYLNTECHTVKLLTYSFQCFELSTLLFFSIEHERTDRSVRTNICTLVTLDTVFSIPFGNECSYTTFFVLSCSLMPSTVFDTLECRNRQQVAILSVDRTNHFVNESRIIVFSLRFIRQIHPCRINCQLLVFTATVNGCVVLVHHVFTLLTVRLNDEFLHLLYSQVNRNNTCDTEECRLQDGVGAVAQADFLCNLSCIDIINSNIMLCKVLLNLVRQILSQFFTFPNSIQQE